jgi:aminoglycoside phosphotransferase family enzyme/predicted kinase
MDPGGLGPAPHLTADGALVAETHSAWVVFLGDRAYKLKKPVTFEFLDFSTRAERERVAHREVVLNRRLAPDVYLGVADVMGPDGRVCDHLVVMRRMPADRRLSVLVRDTRLLDDELRAIARSIAAFHAGATTSPEISAVGTPTGVKSKVDADLDELHEVAGGVLESQVVEEVSLLARRYLGGRARLFDARVAAGCVRDGHGDLLAEDIFCLPDGPRILDCIEFDDRLRYGDVLADVAFLAMDLEHLGAPELASRFLGWYREFANEHYPETLADFYIAFRAVIRSKVSCLRAAQGDAIAGQKARELLSLAQRHLRAARVTLVLVGGSPGTGKSTMAEGLGERFGWSVLRSDAVRKDITGTGRASRSEAPFGAGIYDTTTTEATYGALLDRARRALQLGEPVIADASWARAEWRSAAARVAEETSSDLVELCCELPASTADERIARRQREAHDISDADQTVAHALRAQFNPWPSATLISTAPSPERVVEAAASAILQRDAAQDR